MAQHPESEKAGALSDSETYEYAGALSDTETYEYVRAAETETPAATGEGQIVSIDTTPDTCIVRGSVTRSKQVARDIVVVARSVDGRDEMRATTDKEGVFEFNLEFCGKDYTLSVDSEKYRVHKEAIVTPRVDEPITDVVLRLWRKWSVCGSVTSTNERVPVEDTVLELHAKESYYSSSVFSHEGKTPLRTTEVRADGTYCFDQLGEGAYYIVCRYFFDSADGRRQYRAMMRKATSRESFRGSMDFYLEIGSSISGRVTDENGIPLRNVEVAIGGILETRMALSGEDGTYMIPDVKPNSDERVTAGCDGYHIQCIRLNTEGGGTYEDIDFVLGRGGKILGHVLDARGGKMANVQVYLRPVGPGHKLPDYRPYPVNTDESGTFLFARVVPWEYYFEFEKDGERVIVMQNAPITVVGGQTSRVDVPFTGVDSDSIEGLVTDERGTPLRDVYVAAYNDPHDKPITSTYTNKSGHYVLGGIVDDTLNLVFEPKPGRRMQVTYGGVSLKDIPRDTHVLDIVMPSTGRLHLHVLDAATEQALADSKIESLELRYDTGAAAYGEMIGPKRTEGVPAGGHFFDNVAPGTISFEATASGYAPEEISGVVVSSGEMTELEVLLSKAGTLTGQITLVGDLAELGVMPRIYIEPAASEDRERQKVRPDADSGSYEVVLPSGHYTVQVRTSEMRALDQVSYVRFEEVHEVVIEDGKTTYLDVEIGSRPIYGD